MSNDVETKTEILRASRCVRAGPTISNVADDHETTEDKKPLHAPNHLVGQRCHLGSKDSDEQPLEENKDADGARKVQVSLPDELRALAG